MKNSLFIAALLASGFVMADPAEQQLSKNLADKNSAYQSICLAAMESKEAAKAKAIELGIGRRELTKILCNEQSVMEFAAAHAEESSNWSIATVQ